MVVDVVLFYHRKRDLDRIAHLLDPKSEPCRTHIVTDSKGAKAVKKGLDELESSMGCQYDLPMSERVKFIIPRSEGNLLKPLCERFHGHLFEGSEEQPLEIDLTNAEPWEAVDVCKFSAIADVKLYTAMGSDRKNIDPFPRILRLDEDELDILGLMLNKPGNDFGYDNVARELGMTYSTARRRVGSLEKRECLEDSHNKSVLTGRPDKRFTINSNKLDECEFAFLMNSRAVDKLDNGGKN